MRETLVVWILRNGYDVDEEMVHSTLSEPPNGNRAQEDS
jgi:hypothetical protein